MWFQSFGFAGFCFELCYRTWFGVVGCHFFLAAILVSLVAGDFTSFHISLFVCRGCGVWYSRLFNWESHVAPICESMRHPIVSLVSQWIVIQCQWIKGLRRRKDLIFTCIEWMDLAWLVWSGPYYDVSGTSEEVIFPWSDCCRLWSMQDGSNCVWAGTSERFSHRTTWTSVTSVRSTSLECVLDHM